MDLIASRDACNGGYWYIHVELKERGESLDSASELLVMQALERGGGGREREGEGREREREGGGREGRREGGRGRGRWICVLFNRNQKTKTCTWL